MIKKKPSIEGFFIKLLFFKIRRYRIQQSQYA